MYHFSLSVVLLKRRVMFWNWLHPQASKDIHIRLLSFISLSQTCLQSFSSIPSSPVSLPLSVRQTNVLLLFWASCHCWAISPALISTTHLPGPNLINLIQDGNTLSHTCTHMHTLTHNLSHTASQVCAAGSPVSWVECVWLCDPFSLKRWLRAAVWHSAV